MPQSDVYRKYYTTEVRLRSDNIASFELSISLLLLKLPNYIDAEFIVCLY